MEAPQTFGPSDVTIVVPVGGAAPAWKRSARSLTRLDPAPGEIIVVLDGAGQSGLDDPADVAGILGARVVRLDEQGGPARARNHGARSASGEILFFLDSDVEVPTTLVAQVAREFPVDGEPAAIIGSYDDAPGAPEFLSQYRNLQHHFVHQTSNEEASTFWSGCGAIRRQIFDQVGGFDERYTEPSIEDIELGARLIQAGHAVRLVKSLQVKHLKRWHFGDMVETDLWRRAVPWSELMLRDGELVNDLNVKTRDRASVIAAALASIALVAALLVPGLLGAAAALIVLIVVFNAGFFAFLRRHRGTFFAIRSVAVYWLYLLICGLGFGIAILRVKIRRSRAR